MIPSCFEYYTSLPWPYYLNIRLLKKVLYTNIGQLNNRRFDVGEGVRQGVLYHMGYDEWCKGKIHLWRKENNWLRLAHVIVIFADERATLQRLLQELEE